MRRIKEKLRVCAAIVVAGLLAFGLSAKVHAASVPSLAISQFKITSHNGQFITLYNSTDDVLDMSRYQLEYFNNYDPAKATSSRVVSLSGLVPPHGYFLANDDSLTLCYRLTVDSLSLGFSSTAGQVRVMALGTNSAPTMEDYVSWSKTAATGAQTLPTDISASLLRQPVDDQNNPDIIVPGAGSWRTVLPDPADACNLVSATDTAVTVPTGLAQLLPGTEPPATILSLDSNATPTGLSEADGGLKAPVITEILPNPSGSGNDATDEFIELYNPNDTAFDLTGFGLLVGTTTMHAYNFPPGTELAPLSFKAFYSASTGLSLSNSGGQAKLLDPFASSVSSTQTYGSAKDGLAWALAGGKWYWTARPTPGAANVIDQPQTKKAAAKTTAKKKAVATTKPKTKKSVAKTAKPKKPKKAKNAKTSLSAARVADKQPVAPIHPWSLALVAAAALLYGTYEYRADLANRIHGFRSYVRARRKGGA